MRKFFKSYAAICSPIYPAMGASIQEIVVGLTGKKEVVDPIIHITKANFQKEVKESDLPVVLDAYSNFCPPCKAVAPIFSELSEGYSGKVKFVKLDMEAEYALSQELEIRSMPTFLFFKSGEVVETHVGLIDKKGLLSKIEGLQRY
jgi:thioredoxin 1